MNPLKNIRDFFHKLWHTSASPPEPKRIIITPFKNGRPNTYTVSFDPNYDFYLQDIEVEN